MDSVKNTTAISFFKKTLIVLLGTILLAISSKIKIPFYPVPMTMQTFIVILLGIAFGWKLAMTTMLLYVFQGIIGLPVFSGTPEKGIGLVYFTGPTMGYLLGFIVAATLAGMFNYNKNVFINFMKLTFSVTFIYLLGIIWLGVLLGWDKPLFQIGAQPFLLAELFKVLLVTLLIPYIKKLKKLI